MSRGEESEEEWCAGQRAVVAEYLSGQGAAHGEIGEWPAWHVQPYVAIWAIESLRSPGSVGWWAISGDVPTDYASSWAGSNPRDVLRVFAERWAEAAAQMSAGAMPEGLALGTPSDWPRLAPLLASRAALFSKWVADATLWDSDAA